MKIKLAVILLLIAASTSGCATKAISGQSEQDSLANHANRTGVGRVAVVADGCDVARELRSGFINKPGSEALAMAIATDVASRLPAAGIEVSGIHVPTICSGLVANHTSPEIYEDRTKSAEYLFAKFRLRDETTGDAEPITQFPITPDKRSADDVDALFELTVQVIRNDRHQKAESVASTRNGQRGSRAFEQLRDSFGADHVLLIESRNERIPPSLKAAGVAGGALLVASTPLALAADPRALLTMPLAGAAVMASPMSSNVTKATMVDLKAGKITWRNYIHGKSISLKSTSDLDPMISELLRLDRKKN